MSTLDELDLAFLEEQTMGIAELAVEILDLFIAQSTVQIDELVQRSSAEEREAVRGLAHSLKSSAAIVGARRLRDALEGLEHSALKAPRAELTDGAAAVSRAYTDVRPLVLAARLTYVHAAAQG